MTCGSSEMEESLFQSGYEVAVDLDEKVEHRLKSPEQLSKTIKRLYLGFSSGQIANG